MTFTIEKCPRCGEEHKDMKIKQLAPPSAEANCWCMCPTTKQPIMGLLTLAVVGNKEESRK